MNTTTLDGRAVRVTIREIRITAESGLEARRLADAIAPALERALSGLRSDAPRRSGGRSAQADRVATQIAVAVADRAKGTP